MKNPSKVKLKLTIATIGKGTIAEIFHSYTMKEHSNDKYVKDGEAHALKEFNLKADQVVVQAWPVICESLEEKINEKWGSGKKLVIGHMAIPKIHNPMHSAFRAYRSFDFEGVVVLIKPVSAGVVYAIQNDVWLEEYKTA